MKFDSTSASNYPQLNLNLNLKSIWLWHKRNPILFTHRILIPTFLGFNLNLNHNSFRLIYSVISQWWLSSIDEWFSTILRQRWAFVRVTEIFSKLQLKTWVCCVIKRECVVWYQIVIYQHLKHNSAILVIHSTDSVYSIEIWDFILNHYILSLAPKTVS